VITKNSQWKEELIISFCRGVRQVHIFWSILTILLTKGLDETLYEMKVQYYSSLCILGRLLSTLMCCWLLICALLHRPHNVLLIPAQVFVNKCAGTVCAHHGAHTANTWWLVIAHVCFGTVFYFYQVWRYSMCVCVCSCLSSKLDQ
jgi:hypothetical protein